MAIFNLIFFYIAFLVIRTIIRSAKSVDQTAEKQVQQTVTNQKPVYTGNKPNAKPNNVPVKTQATASSKVPAKELDEDKYAGSTTAYLEEKARLDSIEHAKEKEEESKRILRNAGGLHAAERLIMGDPVPQNKRVVICGYCAAENLVPHNTRERFSCYFCREAL